ncbi:MAG: hypothetical protein AB1657_04370 [Candidatus Micrarchaeota archaeon]
MARVADVYGEKLDSISREMNALTNDIIRHLPQVMEETAQRNAAAELQRALRSLMLHYTEFYRTHRGAPAPTRDTLLTELRFGPNRVRNPDLAYAIDELRGAERGPAILGLPPPPLTLPRTLEEVPAREEAAAAEARRATPRRHAPTIAELQTQGYTDVSQTGYYGMSVRSATNAAGETRYFEVDSMGNAKREISAEHVQALEQLSALAREVLDSITAAVPGYAEMDFDTRSALNSELEKMLSRVASRHASRGEAPERESLLQELKRATRNPEIRAAIDTLA